MNGSSATQQCSFEIRDGLSSCFNPATSVLFDGSILNPTGLGGDMWASQLLTLQKFEFHAALYFDFSTSPGYAGVERVDVVMFNCPEWGIGAETIGVSGALTVPSANNCSSLLGLVNPPFTSCDSLLRVCIPMNTTLPVIALQFFHPITNWVHLAEVTFHNTVNSTLSCPSLLKLPATTSEAPATRSVPSSK